MASTGDTFDPTAVFDEDMGANWDGNDISMFDSSMDQGMIFSTPNMFEDAFGNSPAAATPQFNLDSPARHFPQQTDQKAPPNPHSSLQPRGTTSSASPESSSQDSSSETSSRRKRKTTSSNSSPAALFDAVEMRNTSKPVRKEQNTAAGVSHNGLRDSALSFGAAALSLEHDDTAVNDSMARHFDFESAASSPGAFGVSALNQPAAGVQMLPRSRNGAIITPVSTAVRPQNTSFFLGSRENSPLSAAMATSQEGSPSALFNESPLSANPAVFNPATLWNDPTQTLTWPNDLSSAVLNGAISSPGMDMGNQAFLSDATGSNEMPATLHLTPIHNKSRVETQINIKMTLWPMPPGVTKLHLPTHTISKPKLLAKEAIKAPDTLELGAMLVCTSAMQKPEALKRALARARGVEIPMPKRELRRSSTGDLVNEDDSEDPDKPLNGGEVSICQNCINRERKRASRKRVKKQEDEESWYQYEAQRVIVFNTTEYKEWQQPSPLKEGVPEPIQFPEDAMQIDAPMRIACYCRHQGEKQGFQVIFTIRDHEGRVLAQSMTDSILITDDHKTHGPASMQHGLAMGEQPQYSLSGYFTQEHNDMQPGFQHRPYHSTNDLQSLRGNYRPQPMFTPGGFQQSGVHSQSTSTTMTPRNLSRQASPTIQTGPNKKRKGSSVHHKIPAGLTMTRADAPQSMSMPGISAAGPSTAPLTATSPFSPTNGSFMSLADQAVMVPVGMPPGFNTGPSTPSGNFTSGHRSASTENIPYQFYSVPNSAHTSRAASPVSSARPTRATFHQPQNSLGNGLISPLANTPFGTDTQQQQQQQQPVINKILPAEGPKNGGIEVTCLGSNFHRGLEIMFGDNVATTTTFWSSNSLVCLLPPAVQAGTVPVTFRQQQQVPGFSSSPVATPPVLFRYSDDDEQQLLELALKFLCHKVTGNPEEYRNYARNVVAAGTNAATGWSTQTGAPLNMGLQRGHGAVLNAAMAGMAPTEEALLSCLDLVDMDDSPHVPRLNLKQDNGATMLSLACSLGYGRFVAGLLARGANPDTRDKGGFTPLMMAAMHGHYQIVRRLVLKGADPMMRNLQGYLAADLASSEDVLEALRQVRSFAKTRNAGTLAYHSRASSAASTRSLWDPSTDGFSEYSSVAAEHEDDGGEDRDAMPSISLSPWIDSRRNSAFASRRGSGAFAVPDMRNLALPPAADPSSGLSPAAAMTAWRYQLAAQINYFQQNLHWNFPNFQLPALPPMPNLPDYQAYPVVRRISALVPQRSSSRDRSLRPESASSTEAVGELNPQSLPSTGDYNWRDLFSTPPAPPAYDEIYPENANRGMDIKKASLQASSEALLDPKCAEIFYSPQTEGSSVSSKGSLSKEQQEQLRTAHAQKLKKIRSDRNLFFVWLPLLLIILVAMLRSWIPDLSTTLVTFASILNGQPNDQRPTVTV